MANTNQFHPNGQIDNSTGLSLSHSRGNWGPATDPAPNDGEREFGSGTPNPENWHNREHGSNNPQSPNQAERPNSRHNSHQRQNDPANSTMRNPRAHKCLAKTTKSNMKIATLNMRGQTNSNPLTPTNKWEKINQLMKQRKLAMLAIQEAHLTNAQKEVRKLNIKDWEYISHKDKTQEQWEWHLS